MTWFNFLSKDVIVDCYTARADVYNFSPIKKASVYLPDWWKTLPKTFPNPINPLLTSSTMKHCVGFTDLFAKGFMIPLWSDVVVQIGGQQDQHEHNYNYQFADFESKIDHHAERDMNGFYSFTDYQHLKFISPWRLTCNEEIEFLLLDPTWCNDAPDEMFVPPGVVNFKYQCGTNVNMFFRRRADTTAYTLKHNMPLAHFIPLTERKIKLKLHLVSEQELQRVSNINKAVTFINKYKNNKSILKERGCPFHHEVEK